MKAKRVTLAVGLGLLLAFVGFSQTPPPNDNYSNSITLTGTDVTFSGTLAGATIEGAGEINIYTNFFYTPTRSVWWNWTAPTNTILTLEVLSPIESYTNDLLVVYAVTNGVTNLAELPAMAVGTNYAFLFPHPRTLSVPVTTGIQYQIQLIGVSSLNYTLRLQATNAPIIIQQPRSQAVSPGESALFYVVYSGFVTTNLNFQWRFNGTNMSGENAPMFALTNVNATMAGNYDVVVSSMTGSTTSAVATLAVGPANVSGALSPISASSNFFTLSVSGGEPGRSYAIQSSTDLATWNPVAYYIFDFNQWGFYYDVFFNAGPQVLNVTGGAQQEYFRTTPHVITDPHTAICDNNLRKIRVAKLLWYCDNNLAPATAFPVDTDLLPYFPHKTLPICPDDPYQSFDSSYYPAALVAEPSCQAEPVRHFLEEPR